MNKDLFCSTDSELSHSDIQIDVSEDRPPATSAIDIFDQEVKAGDLVAFISQQYKGLQGLQVGKIHQVQGPNKILITPEYGQAPYIRYPRFSNYFVKMPNEVRMLRLLKS